MALIGIAMFLAIGSAIAMLVTSAVRPLSSLELGLWQVLSLAAGLFGSYKFGQSSSASAARNLIRPHARSALRTVLSLRDSLFRLSNTIEEFKTTDADYRLDVIQAIVTEQIPIGRSAVEDWIDIVPNDVEEVLNQWTEEAGVKNYVNAD